MERLVDFVPRMGPDYAARRNFDYGPSNRRNVSGLSPYIRHRLVTEREVLAFALEAHSLREAEKFVQEVFWRTYFKGWLEQHPGVWHNYVADVGDLVEALDNDAALRDRYELAVGGRTGIECLDAWVTELVELGYLHNHARMWFASIWVFTLDLPWQLGADLFLRHLLDGDPASNTLSWRWVSGLHTKGKTYLARASNIYKYTDGRFDPADALATRAPPLREPHRVERVELRQPNAASGPGDWGLVVTEDDCAIDALDVDTPPSAVIGLTATSARSPLKLGRPARAFARAAVADGVDRASQRFAVDGCTADSEDWGEELIRFAAERGLRRLVVPYTPVGPTGTRLAEAKSLLETNGINWQERMRDHDRRSWPHASRGYFKLKSTIPELIGRVV